MGARRTKQQKIDAVKLVDAKKKMGLTMEAACEASGIAPSQYYQWRKLAEDSTEEESTQLPGRAIPGVYAESPELEITIEQSIEDLSVDDLVTRMMGQQSIETVIDRWLGISQVLGSEAASDEARIAGRFIDEFAYEIQKVLGLAEEETQDAG